MSDDETIPIGEAVRSLEAMGDKLRRTRNERDRYRDWFTKLDAAFVEYIAAVRPILARDPLAAANAKRSAIADERRARAWAYRERGWTVPRITARMNQDEGLSAESDVGPPMHSERTVREWLAEERKRRPS